MLAIAEAGGHSPSLATLAEAGEGHHLPGLGDLEGTSLSQGLTACKRNNKKNIWRHMMKRIELKMSKICSSIFTKRKQKN